MIAFVVMVFCFQWSDPPNVPAGESPAWRVIRTDGVGHAFSGLTPNVPAGESPAWCVIRTVWDTLALDAGPEGGTQAGQEATQASSSVQTQ